MKKIKEFLKSKYFFYFISYVVFLITALNIPLVADDISFSMIEGTTDRIKTIFDIAKSVSMNYLGWNGRIFGYGFTEICLLGENHIVFDILYPVINIIIIEEVAQLFDDKKISTHYLFLALILSHYVLVLNQTVFWIIGWAIYVASLVPFLYILKYVKCLFYNQENKCNKYILFFASIIGCLFIELYSIIIICLSVICFVRDVIRRNIHSETIYLLIGSIIGCLIIFLSPGMSNRVDTGILPNSSTFQKLLFGWTRFVYCYFYLNQKIFLLISIGIIGLLFHKRDKNKKFIIVALSPIIVLSLILIIYPKLLGPVFSECLTGAWTYYTCRLKDVFIVALIVCYYIFVLLICIIYICHINKNYFIFFLYGAAICSNLCFITTTLACERTQFISYILLVIIFLCIINEFLTNKMLCIIIPIIFVIIAYLSIKYICAYSHEYQIYKENDALYRSCAKTKQKEIRIQEHNYQYIFKSDLNFEDQNMWIFDAIRRYYNLEDDVVILPK